MLVGIRIKHDHIWRPTYRFMKMLKEGFNNTGNNSVPPSKEKIVEVHNQVAEGIHSLLSTGLVTEHQDHESILIDESQVFINEEVEELLSEHQINARAFSYYDLDQRFIWIDTSNNTLNHK